MSPKECPDTLWAALIAAQGLHLNEGCHFNPSFFSVVYSSILQWNQEQVNTSYSDSKFVKDRKFVYAYRNKIEEETMACIFISSSLDIYKKAEKSKTYFFRHVYSSYTNISNCYLSTFTSSNEMTLLCTSTPQVLATSLFNLAWQTWQGINYHKRKL